MKQLRLLSLLCAAILFLAPLPTQPSAHSQANINAPNGLNGRRNQGQSNKPDSQPSKPDKPSNGSNNPSKPDKPSSGNRNENSSSSSSNSSSGSSSRNQKVAGHRQGWRIQAFQSSNSREGKQKATERARAIAMKYPQYRTYITYKAPAWRLRLGDFESEEAAKNAIKYIRASFPGFASEMTVVRDKVNIWR